MCIQTCWRFFLVRSAKAWVNAVWVLCFTFSRPERCTVGYVCRSILRHQPFVVTRLNLVFLLFMKRATDTFDLLPTPSQGRTLMIPGKELRAWSTRSGDVPGSRKRCFCPFFDLTRSFHLTVFWCLTIMIFYFAINFSLFSWSSAIKHKPRNLNG